MYEEHPELRDGLVDLGLLPEYARTGESAHGGPEAREGESEEEKRAGSFVLAFGKHAGKPLREVPRGYLSWMAREGVATDRGGGLDDALRCLGYDVAAPISERQRRPEVDLDDVDDVPF